MFEREVTARRLFRNDKKRQTVRSTPADTLQTVDFVRCYVVSSGVYATLRAIPCPNVAWSGVELHLECVGPSIILLCKYLHKETGLLPLAKTRESSRGTHFFNTIYSYGERERVSGKTKERKKGALWDKKPEESGGKGLMDMLRKKNKKHRNNQTDEETGFGVQRGKDGREEKKKTSEQSVTS